MIRDSNLVRGILKHGKDKLPEPSILYGPAIAEGGTNDPRYINMQVADILIELQGGPPVEPFVEGEQIGTLDPVMSPEYVFGVSSKAWNAASARVWAAHDRLARGIKRHSYTTDRKIEGRAFRFTWRPEVKAFSVVEL